MVVLPYLLHEARRNSTLVYRKISKDRLFSTLKKIVIFNFLSQDTGLKGCLQAVTIQIQRNQNAGEKQKKTPGKGNFKSLARC